MQKGGRNPDWPAKPGSGDGLRVPGERRAGEGRNAAGTQRRPGGPKPARGRRWGEEGEVEGARRPPPRPSGLQHVALVARRLRVPAGTTECRGAWPRRYLPRRPRLHSRQGWGGCPKKRSGGGVGWGPRAPCHCQGVLLHPQLPLPPPPQGPFGPRRRRGPCVAAWKSGAQTKEGAAPVPQGLGARGLTKGSIRCFAGEKRCQGPLCTWADLTPTPGLRPETVPQAL